MTTGVKIVESIEYQSEGSEERYRKEVGVLDIGVVGGKRTGWIESRGDFFGYLM